MNIEVSHPWRRAATKTHLERLWSAMELGRDGSLGADGDEVLQEQRDAFTAFATAMLGDDAPFVMVADTGILPQRGEPYPEPAKPAQTQKRRR